MKIRNRKLAALMLAGILGVLMAGGCSSEKETEEHSNPSEASDTVGTFETTDIEGNSYTDKIFEEHELTMVNIFATWCSPCVQELPELQKLYEEMEEKDVGVVGVVMDTVDEKGNPDDEGLKKAMELKNQLNITYPFLIPDSGNMNGQLSGVQAFPTTFFVDRSGNVVGETYEGSGSLEDWREVVQEELENLKGDK